MFKMSKMSSSNDKLTKSIKYKLWSTIKLLMFCSMSLRDNLPPLPITSMECPLLFFKMQVKREDYLVPTKNYPDLKK